MLFDLRGKRKRVIQVVYAMLALLMGGGLVFFGIGSGSGTGGIADLLNGGGGGGSPQFDEQAQKIEEKLRRDPKDEQLLAQLVRARYTAGNSQVSFDSTTGAPSLTEGALEDFSKAADAWQRYLKVEKHPNPNVATLATNALFYSGAAATTASEFESSMRSAAKAQEIVNRSRPTLNGYLSLARYEFYSGNFGPGEEAGRKAAQEAPKSRRSLVEQAVTQYRKQGQQIQKQIKAATKFKPGGQGKQALQSPLGGLSGGGSGLGTTAP